MIPIVLHHYPICVSYALFSGGTIPVADPTALEERVSDASLVLAVNSYRELCSMHLTGVALTSPNLISRCSEIAAERSRRIVEFIKSTIDEDATERAKGNFPKGFAEAIKLSNVPSNFLNEAKVEKAEDPETVAMEEDSEEETSEDEVKVIDSKTVISGQWKEDETVSTEESSSDEDMPQETKKPMGVKPVKLSKARHDSDSSEEETTIVLK